MLSSLYLFSFVFLAQLLNGLAIVPPPARPFVLGAMFCAAVVTAALIFSPARVFGVPSLKSEAKVSWKQIPIAAAVGVIFIGTAQIFATMPIPLPQLVETYVPWVQLVELFGMPNWLYWLVGAFVPAVLEETTYKSLLLKALPSACPKWQFVSISAATFALVHIEHGLLWVGLITLLYGIPSAIYYYEERSIGALLVLHCSADLYAFRSLVL